MTYSLTASSSIIVRDADQAFIPDDPNNNDYAAYLVWVVAGNVATPYAPPAPPVPQTISDRQFFQELAIQGKITQDEAIAAVSSGAMPASMAALVAELPSAAQFGAKMLIQGATSFDRSNPLTATLGSLYSMASADLDALWTAASLL